MQAKRKHWAMGWVGCWSLVSACGQVDTEPSQATEPKPVATLVEAVAQAVPEGFQEELFLSGRSEPTAVRFTPDGRVIVAEKSGQIWAYGTLDNPGTGVRLIDLRTPTHNFWDRGVLGLAVHPQFPSVPHVYVLYTLDAFSDGSVPRWGTPGSSADNCPNPPGATENGCVVNGRLSRVVVDPQTWQGTEQVLLTGRWCQQFPSHSVGDVAFASDNTLYVTAGDGASFNQADWGQTGNPCSDPANEGGALRSQDLLTPSDPTSFDGALLRLDVSGPNAVAAAGNPLLNNGVADDDPVVAIGLRNPFRIATRPNTSQVWIADVGWNAWEELNVYDPGSGVPNYGWPCYEGTEQQSGYASRALCQQLYAGTMPSGMQLRAPYYAYHHSALVAPGDGCGTGSSAVTGVAFNSSSVYPQSYAGALFFADSSRQCVWTMFAGANGDPNPAQRAVFVQKASGRIVDIQMGPDGLLYYVDFDGGNVYRIAYFTQNTPPQAALTASPLSGPTPLAVALDASASSDAEDGSELQFAWDLDGDGQFDDGVGALQNTTLSTPGLHVVRVRVTDSGGEFRVASVTVSADNSPPVPVIETPTEGAQWSVGDVLTFSGSAVDPETGPVPAEQLSWRLLMHHCSTLDNCHEHPITAWSGVASGSFTAPDHEYPSYLELRLTASDANGAGGDWQFPGWSNRIPLSISGAFSGGAQQDIPVLVRLDASRIDYTKTAPGGADLRFGNAEHAHLEHEIEVWNPGGISEVWVKLPTLSSASGEQLYLYYGNPDASDGQHADEVWSNGYAAVWHLGAALTDSTGNDNSGVNQGATLSAGQIGNAYTFNGLTSYLDMGAGPSLALTGQLSVEAWVKLADPNRDAYDRVVSKKLTWDAAAGFNLEVQPGLNYLGALGAGSDYLRAEGVNLDTQWHYVASSMNGTTGALYHNGVNVTTDGSVGSVTASTTPLNIGRRSGGGDYFWGAIDEVRISNVPRSAGWFAAQFAAQRDALFSYGPPQSAVVLSATTSLTLLPNIADVSFDTDPPGLMLSVGSQSVVGPHTKTAIVGSSISVDAPATQQLGGVSYAFQGWSNGGAAAHAYEVSSAGGTLIAFYTEQTELPCPNGVCEANEDCSSCAADCGACPTCSDGIQNQGETGVDCGGPNCAPCPSLPSAVWLEAESGVRSGSPTFSLVNDASAASGVYLLPSGNSTASPGPNRVTFSVNVAAGTYRLWGRVIAPTADDDSFWVSVDGSAFVRWNDIARSSAWLWDEVHNSDASNAVMTYTLGAGSHTIVIANREDGTRLDKLYLTALGDTPSGTGEPASCNDGIQNQGETGVDCGGPCPACAASCGDGLCNGSESCGTCALDCGACPTCNDGIQNQGETGVDCGGPCAPCSTGSCTCPSGCGALQNRTVPFTVDGVVNACYFFTGSLGAYVNSWNTQQVNINGTSFTNQYVGASGYPARINGGYYLYVQSNVSWAHAEVR